MMKLEIREYFEAIKTKTTIKPKVLFEAGSKTGEDAELLATNAGIPSEGVYVIEPHMTMYKNIVRDYPQYKVFNLALYNEEKLLNFHEADDLDDGRSSLMERDIYNKGFTSKEVQARRMDSFMEEHNITSIDMFKLDVEGASYEVLEGFGDRITDLKSVQIEAEYGEVWEKQKTWGAVVDFMIENGFKMIWEHNIINIQVDSVWVRKEYLK